MKTKISTSTDLFLSLQRAEFLCIVGKEATENFIISEKYAAMFDVILTEIKDAMINCKELIGGRDE